MRGQDRLVEGVANLSPSREAWVGRDVRDMPARLTVQFGSGQSGILDLRDARGRHWAKLIDNSQRRRGRIYVEIDAETRVITNVRVPRRHRVARLEADPLGNFRVYLRTAQAMRLLLRTAPNFDAMRASLEAALAAGTERLITETRDEHEIMDVREAEPESEDLPPPGPPLPDPPVSEARAQEVFDNMAAESCSPCSPSGECVSFLYPDDGCWIRAHIMCHLMRTGGPNATTNPPEDPEKVWIHANTRLVAPTVNHPDCKVEWGWHVAPTLMVSLSTGDEKRVIDPSLSPSPESKAAWKGRQGDPAATLTDTPWTDYNWVGDTRNISLADARSDMQHYRDELLDRCLDFGPPPYSCTKRCFFIVDRSTFSDDEVEALLLTSMPAVVPEAFYVVVDGFSPQELGFTTATMEMTPNLNVTPGPSGLTLTPDRLEFEYPTHLNRRQRLTWVYNAVFADTSAFTSDIITVALQATLATVSGAAQLLLIRQPNPYETDGAISWLSTDLRVFQIQDGQSKFGVGMASDPNAFITQAIGNLNSGNTAGQTFENDISTDQATSRLELSSTVNGTPVFNFAVAKVRYRSLVASAMDVRVFFRLFPVATTSLEYDQSTTYRRFQSGGTVIPLLGIKNGEVVAIPCFAAARIDSATTSLTAQTDPPNVQTIPPDSGGAEVVRYFGCYLDFNQPQPQFPIQPSPADGPFASDRVSIQELIRNEHQCLVSEIAFLPAPAQNGATPSISDKLAQRNLAIVESANPGVNYSRRVPQTFELQPSRGKVDNDELMIEWGNLPEGSLATLYIPGLDMNEVRLLAARTYRSHRFERLDEHTLKLGTGGITYVPLPFTDRVLPGLLTVDLPEGIVKGQVFKIVVRQVTGGYEDPNRVRLVSRNTARHIVGSFQLTIPVSIKTAMLAGQQRLLSNLRWIEGAIPAGNRWTAVFHRYVELIAARVDDLGGDSSKVAPSPSGQWQAAYRTCFTLLIVAALLVAALLVGAALAPSAPLVVGGVAAAALLGIVVSMWRRICRASPCQLLRALLVGSIIAVVVLLVLLVMGMSTVRLIAVLVMAGAIALVAATMSWIKGCFRKSG